MTVPMSTIENIRALDARGVSGRQIAEELGVSRDSVAKYVAAEDFSPQPPGPRTRPGRSALAGFTEQIEAWLTEDLAKPRKQRHTATRVHHRLRDECGYVGSYSPVQRFVKAFKTRHRTGGDGFLHLTWPPGSAQVDFGQAEAVIAGVAEVVHLLVVSYPQSNMRFALAYRGETAECVCDGLRRVFEHAGAAPRVLVFDNATGVGRRTGDTVIESVLFAAFKAHYRLVARYCNPYAGNEKGSVENAVGFLRRNLMVPVPQVASLAELNAHLMAGCVAMGTSTHWRKGERIDALFAADVAAGVALPGVAFDPVRYESRRADNTGTVVVENNTYLAGPRFHNMHLTVGIRHDVIEILDEHAHPVVVFDRLYGHHPDTQLHVLSLLPALAAKPGAWAHSPARTQLPDPLREWLDQAPAKARRQALTDLHAAAAGSGYDHAVEAAVRLLAQGSDPAGPGLDMLAHRIRAGSEPAPTPVDLGVYDQLCGTAATTTGATA